MKKIVPITLILLMVASVFAQTTWIDLNENETSEEADGRAANDAALQGIHSPRATKSDAFTGELRNTVKSGESVNIDIAVQNVGDNNITEMNIEATIYLADGTVATDPGPDGQLGTADDSTLSWTDAVICDDAASCPYDNLESGDWLGGGSYNVRDSSGAAIAWSAMLGEYTIAVEVDVLSGDDDEANDMSTVDFTVVNWYDLGVELSWDDGEDPTTSGVHDFTMSVVSDGSEEWSARNVSVDLIVSGAPLTSAETGGNSILGTSEHIAGTSQVVEVFFNVSADCLDPGPDNITGTADDGPCDPRNGNGTRTVVDFGVAWTLAGSVDVDGNADGSYTVEAILKSYTIFGAAAECTETWEEESLDPNNNTIRETKTSNNMCEVDVETDDNNSNNEDDISGYIGSFHDIGVSSVIVAQGYDSMGQGDATSIATDGDIGVGFSKLHATVEHRGSAGTGPYDWEVDFTVTDLSDDSTTTYTADECLTGVAPSYQHGMLGDSMGGQPAGYACVEHTFASGKYKVEAAVSMVNSSSPDENSANDDGYGVFDARNNDPVLSLSLTTQGDIKVGDIVTFDADAFDAEDLTGESLSYDWNRVTTDGISVPIGECNAGDDFPNGQRVCTTPIDSSWATVLPVSVTVTDPHGGEDSASHDLTVWNVGVGTGSSGDGAVSVSYALTYLAASDFTIAVTDGDAVTGVMLGSNSVDSLYVLDMSLVHKDAADVLEQTLTVTFPGTVGEDYSLYYELEGQGWTLLDGDAVQADSTNMTFEWDGAGVGGTLYSGKLGIFNVGGGPSDVPANGISAAWGENLAGGDIAVKWNLSNDGADLLASDSVQICTSADTCSTLAKDSTQHIISGDHGEVFNVTVSVVNANGANADVGTFTATADAQVDPVPAIDFGAVTNGTASWTIALTTTDAGDAESFHVCWKNGVFTAAQLTPEDLSCVAADKLDASVDVTKPGDTTQVVYHFAIYAEDDAGNILATDASTSITRWGTSSGDGGDGGTLGEDVEGEQSVPTWAWGVIIGIVVVAFGIGAFILSRGGEGGEGKEWDY